MSQTTYEELPTVDTGPSETEMVAEIFAEATRQDISQVQLSQRTNINLQKIGRFKRREARPTIDEFRALCRAVGKTWRQIEDAATFHSTLQ